MAFPLKDRFSSRRIWQWLLAVAMAVLLVLSLLPLAVDLPTTGWDKANHVLGFAILGWLGRWAWPRRTGIALTGLLAYGGLIELLQSLVPGRYAEFGDLVADGIGLLLGAATAALVDRWARHVSES